MAEKEKLFALSQDRREGKEKGSGVCVEIRELDDFLYPNSQMETQRRVKAPERERLLGGTRLMDSGGPSGSQERAMNLEEPH